MKATRSSGVLLHPTSLPGPYGIGDVGPEARRFVDFLAGAGSSLWQVLPLGPTGFGDSPYQAVSAFAGNTDLISPDLLVEDGLLGPAEAGEARVPGGPIDFGAVVPRKRALVERAWTRFRSSPPAPLRDAFAAFRATEARWLDDYALFAALKGAHEGGAWADWPEPIRRRRADALDEARRACASAIERETFAQFLFFRQWGALRGHAAARGVRIIGDVPIFVAHDSADVWAHPDLFRLDGAGRPAVVAGVPPDYFAKTGQRWGNPLYAWEAHARAGYAWWIDRLRSILRRVDLARLDHFRGFVACWEVPAEHPTAAQGRWTPGPGARFLEAVRDALGDLPFIAEDLGDITTEVETLRDAFRLPGMKVLQFAFSGADNPFLPHRHPRRCVVYTGTHDNDTTRGWYGSAPEEVRDFCRRYLGRDGSDIAWDLIRAAWGSVAALAIAPMQDLLDLDSRARMNHPGRDRGSWTWRMADGALADRLQARLRDLNDVYGRAPRARRPAASR